MSQGSLQLAGSIGPDQPSARAISRDDPAQANPQAETTASEQDSGGGFFQTCLAKSRRSTSPEGQFWRHRIYDEIRGRRRLQGCLRVEQMCQLAEVGRAGFYRYLQRGSGAEKPPAPRPPTPSLLINHPTPHP